MNAVIYARYSAGPGQNEQSIEGQLRDCRDYAKKNDITIIDTYIDRHISGTDFENRTEFNRLIKDCERHQFSAVIVWKVDRFGRNREEIAMNKVKMKKHGVKLLYAKEHIPNGPEGIILESLLEGMAEYYSAELSQKVRRGLRESMLKGHALGGNLMLGYKIINKKYVVDPVTSPIVVEIFERYAAGETAKAIATDLNTRGVVNAKGDPFKNNTIYFILRNEKYIGIYRYGDIVVNDVIHPIINMELWGKVQMILEMNSRNRSRSRCTAPEEFLLTGKIFCEYCKRPIIGESGTSRNGASHYYYKCSSRKNKGVKCEKSTVRKTDLENFIISQTIDNVLQPDTIDYLAKKVVEIQNSDAQELQMQSLRKQLSDVQKGLNNLVNAVEMGIITETTKERMMALEERKEELKICIAKAEIKRPKLTEEMVEYWLNKFRDQDVDSTEFKIRLINTFVNSIYLHNDYAIIVYNFCDDESGHRAEIRAQLDDALRAKKEDQTCSSDPTQVPATVLQTNILLITLTIFAIKFRIPRK